MINEIKWNANSSAWHKFWNTCNKLSILILFFVNSPHHKSHVNHEPSSDSKIQYLAGWIQCDWSSLMHSSLVPTISVFRLKLNEINIIHSGPLKLSPWVVLTKHICKKTSGHSSICAPTKPFYINTTTSNSVNLGSEEQLTIICSSLNECISFAVRVFYQVFLHVQKWKTMLQLHVTNTTNYIAWTWDRYPSTVRFHQTRVTWSLNTADNQCSAQIMVLWDGTLVNEYDPS
jgi:hypothetical protein